MRYFDGSSWTGHGVPPSPGANLCRALVLTAGSTIFGLRANEIESWVIGTTSVWTPVLSTIAGPIRNAVRLGTHLYIATDAGLLYSTDYGNYAPETLGLRGVWVTSFSGRPTDASIVFASTKSGVYRSSDGGASRR